MIPDVSLTVTEDQAIGEGTRALARRKRSEMERRQTDELNRGIRALACTILREAGRPMSLVELIERLRAANPALSEHVLLRALVSGHIWETGKFVPLVTSNTWQTDAGTTDDLSLDAALKRHIRFVYNHASHIQRRAAKLLGISRSTLARYLRDMDPN